MSYIDGTFHWHKHINHDELFYLIKGKLIIQLKNLPDITLSPGEMTVIEKGIEHCPKSIEPSYVLLFEPISLQTHGDYKIFSQGFVFLRFYNYAFIKNYA